MTASALGEPKALLIESWNACPSASTSRGAWHGALVINARFERATYRRRNVVERCVSWRKQNRQPAARPSKLAANDLATA